MKLLFTLLISVFSVLSAWGQEPQKGRGCGTAVPSKEWDEWFNQKVAEYEAASSRPSAASATIVIPVIFHVVHGGEAPGSFPNISTAQIYSQIKVLNDDFAGKGYNVHKLAATGFSAIGAANTNIVFCPAQRAPDGSLLAEPGIDRIDYNAKGWTNPREFGSVGAFQGFIDNTVKPNSIWNPSQYYNIWVTDVNPSTFLLGYATFPGGTGLSGVTSGFGSGSTDGVWVWAKALGDVGTLDGLYNKGRTITHETGHWLGLRHIGGDASSPQGDCNATDHVNDTPPQKGGYGGGSNGQNYGDPPYPLHANVCGSAHGDMFMNFMDYSVDAAVYMFTPDQAVRMHVALSNGTFRKSLSTSSATQCAGPPKAELIEMTTGCTSDPLRLLKNLSGAAPLSSSWQVEPPVGVGILPSALEPDPQFIFTSAGEYTITNVSTNAAGSATSSIVLDVKICTGINEQDAETAIKLYPHPVQDRLSISGVEWGIEKVMICNALGEWQPSIHSSDKGTHIHINTENLSPGVYILVAEGSGRKLTKRFVVYR